MTELVLLVDGFLEVAVPDMMFSGVSRDIVDVSPCFLFLEPPTLPFTTRIILL